MGERWKACEQPPGNEYTLASALAKVDSAYAKSNPGTAAGSDEGHRTVAFTRASSIKVRSVHWLWQGRIALGTLALLAGPGYRQVNARVRPGRADH